MISCYLTQALTTRSAAAQSTHRARMARIHQVNSLTPRVRSAEHHRGISQLTPRARWSHNGQCFERTDGDHLILPSICRPQRGSNNRPDPTRPAERPDPSATFLDARWSDPDYAQTLIHSPRLVEVLSMVKSSAPNFSLAFAIYAAVQLVSFSPTWISSLGENMPTLVLFVADG